MRAVLAALLVLSVGFPHWGFAAETYDLIFRSGTLDDVPKDHSLSYSRDVVVKGNEESAGANTGEIKLTFEPEDLARLKFFKDGRHKNIGQFPATVGNPMIMYFVETVVRDMAENSGGSPFYIRNRVKDSLVKFAEIKSSSVEVEGKQVDVQLITLRPFLNDKNSGKMKGYDKMALTITMSEDIPGWYYSLAATVNSGSADPIYENVITYTGQTP